MRKLLLLIAALVACSGEYPSGDADAGLSVSKQALTSVTMHAEYERKWFIRNLFPGSQSDIRWDVRHPTGMFNMPEGTKVELQCSSPTPVAQQFFYFGAVGNVQISAENGSNCVLFIKASLESGLSISKENFDQNPVDPEVSYTVWGGVWPPPASAIDDIEITQSGDPDTHWAFNGLSVFEHIYDVLDGQGLFNGGSATAWANMRPYSDHESGFNCGMGGYPSLCCGFDPGESVDFHICAHEAGHSLSNGTRIVNGKSSLPYPANTTNYPSSCQMGFYEDPRASATESIANLTDLVATYFSSSIGNVQDYQGFCFPGDTGNDCSECSPTTSSYPTFGSDYCPADHVVGQWDECRALKLFTQTIDPESRSGCLNVSNPIRYYDVFRASVEVNSNDTDPTNGDGNAIYSNEAFTAMDMLDKAYTYAPGLSSATENTQIFRSWANVCYPASETANSVIGAATQDPQ